MPGDVVDILELKSDNQVIGFDSKEFKVFRGLCELQDIAVTVYVHTGLLGDDISLPLKVMVDAFMHVAPKLLIIGATAAVGKSILEYDAAYPSQGLESMLAPQICQFLFFGSFGKVRKVFFMFWQS